MLKRHSKLVVLLVALTFVFSFVASAGAATFSDVSGASAQSAAIYKLNSLGIIDGYPDGTFGPDKTITRAEFAKIAGYLAGLGDVAKGMQSAPSTFSDVKTSDWFNGAVNLAASQGYVKGYPDGTFKPNAPVTQAEVITVMMRILGYNDNLPGNWPADYIAKAANLGVLDDVTFDANAPATRGIVCILGSATLDQNVVTYRASDNYFDEGTTPKTLLVSKFKDYENVIEKALVYKVSLADGKVHFYMNYYDADGNLKSADKDLAANCVFANASSWSGAAYRYIDFMCNDDGDINWIKVRDYQVVKVDDPSKIKVDSVKFNSDGDKVVSGKIKVDSKTYDIAPDFSENSSDPQAAGFKFFAACAPGGLLAGKNLQEFTLNGMLGSTKIDSVNLVLNKDGKVGFVQASIYPSGKWQYWRGEKDSSNQPVMVDYFHTAGVVKSVNTKLAKITLVSGGSIDLNEDDPDSYVISKLGQPATLADIKPGDFVYHINKFDVDFVLDATIPASGKLTSIEGDAIGGAKVTIGDKTYKMVWDGGLLSTDDGDSFAAASLSGLNDLLDNDVKAILTPNGKVAAIIASSVGGSNTIYGVVNDNTSQTLVNGKLKYAVEILKADGTLSTYSYDDDSVIYNSAYQNVKIKDKVAADGKIDALLPLKSLVALTLTSDGYIDTIKVGDKVKDATVASSTSLTGDKDNKVITIGGYSYDASNVVVFNVYPVPGDDADVLNTADFLDKIDGASSFGSVSLSYVVSSGKIKYLVVNQDTLQGSTNNVAMVNRVYSTKDAKMVELLLKDGLKSYEAKGEPGSIDNTVINYEFVSGKIKINGWSGWQSVTAHVYEIDNISGNIITLKDGTKDAQGKPAPRTKNFYVDKDTLYYDNSGDDPAVAELADFATGDKVKVYQEKVNGVLKAVELVKSSEPLDTGL